MKPSININSELLSAVKMGGVCAHLMFNEHATHPFQYKISRIQFSIQCKLAHLSKVSALDSPVVSHFR